METATSIKEYTAPSTPVRGCLDRVVSKSAYEYLKLKMYRDGGKVVPEIKNNTHLRYGMKTTPTTRRTDYDHDNRRYY